MNKKLQNKTTVKKITKNVANLAISGILMVVINYLAGKLHGFLYSKIVR